MERYDLCILGAGPAGFAAAMRAHDLGKSVVLVERDRPGGAGIHHGALSSKTLWEIAKDYASACRTDRGYRAENIQLSYAEVCAAVRAAETQRRSLLEHQIDVLASTGPGRIVYRRGTARFASPEVVEISGGDPVTASFFLIATGSRPRVPDGIPADGVRVLTSDHLDDLPDFPSRLMVVGAGVVGCEYATVFARFGRTEVHLLDREARILPFEDEDVSTTISDSFRGMGMTIHHRGRLASVDTSGPGVQCTLDGPDGLHTVDASHLLLSIGRVANTDTIGLDVAGVLVTPSGTVQAVDTRTSVANIYAAGDTTADVALANVAELEGRHAVERMFGLDPRPLRYDALSSILFLAPEVASVGLNEQQAKAKGVPYQVAMIGNPVVARNVAMRELTGFVKLLAHPDGRLLGLRVVGRQASSTIQGVALLIDRGGTLEDLDRCFHPHPAVPEGVQECARLLLGRSVYKPGVHPNLLRVASG